MSVSIISSHYREDIKWLEDFDCPVFIFSKKGANTEKVNKENYFVFKEIPNVCREAFSYLFYIVNYWDQLADSNFFIHGHEYAYHQRMPIKVALEQHQKKDFFDFNYYFKYNFVYDDKQKIFLYLWNELYKNLGDMPMNITCDTCAQFVVSKDAIKQRSKSFYENLLNKLFNLCHDKETNFNYRCGAFFELTWHILFGKNALNYETTSIVGNFDPKFIPQVNETYVKNKRVYACRDFLHKEIIEINNHLLLIHLKIFPLIKNYDYLNLYSPFQNKFCHIKLNENFKDYYLSCGNALLYKKSNSPNVTLYATEENVYAFCLRDIKKDEELTFFDKK